MALFEKTAIVARYFWLGGISVWLLSTVAGFGASPGSVVAWGINDNGEISVPGDATNVIALAAGSDHSLALRSDGTVVGWGNSTFGQANVPIGLTNVVAIAAGWYHSLALKNDGSVAAWGHGGFGQLDPPANLTNVMAIAADGYTSLALRSDGTVVGWGYNGYGEINIPANLTNGMAIAEGSRNSLILLSNRTLLVFGDNSSGQLNVPGTLTNCIMVDGGPSFNLALKSDGTVVCWGNNQDGVTNVPPNLTNAVAISAGAGHVLALKEDGSVVGWGNPGFGALPVPSDLSNVIAIAAGGNFSLAITRAPVIATQPASQTVVKGTNVTFGVLVNSAYPLGFQWRFNGTNIGGATNATLVLTNVQASAAGSYLVVVSNAFAAVTSSAAMLNVNTAPSITTQPISQTVSAGTNVTLSVIANGTSPLSFQWRLGGANLPGKTTGNLSIANVQFTNGGSYTVVVTNFLGSATSAPAILTVNSGPILTAQPTNQSVIAGSNATFTVTAMGNSPITYRWYFNGSALTPATNATLSLSNVQAANTGNYFAVVTNPFGFITSVVAVLTVVFPPGITVQPTNQSASAGANVAFTAVASGTPPLFYQWQLSGINIPNATTAVLTVTNVQSADAGDYLVSVTNAYGSITSSQARLSVHAAGPSILIQPASQTVPAGTNVQLSVTATGTDPLSYQWTFSGAPIGDATNASLTLIDVQTNAAGTYGVTVSNTKGSIPSAPANLAVIPAGPSIIIQPASQIVFPGAAAQFNVTARGSAPLAYFWLLQNTALIGQTNSSATISNAQSTIAGMYQVVVTNAYGSITSAAAPLTVVYANPTEIDWPLITISQAVSGAQLPTQITHAGDGSGRIFVVQQQGQIRIIRNGNFLSTPFLNISNRVMSFAPEQGLLSVVFPTGYATNGHFYVNYTRQSDGATVVSRFFVSTNADLADPASEQIVLTVLQPFDNHNGGQLAFGPDGYLYVGMGDGGSEGDPNNQAQTPGSLLGKLLRIDVESVTNSYFVPASNPFVANAAYRPEIWALGLRNPWRFSFDRLTGDLYIGDVGQDNWEEIDFQSHSSHGGQNYGWRILEANHTNNVPSGFNLSSLTPPVIEYSHSVGSCAVGGFVFRGPGSSRMSGMYFYGDFISGRLWGMKFDGTNWQNRELMRTPYNISTFGEDEAGRLYFANYNYGSSAIYLVQDSGAAAAPTLNPGTGSYNSEQSVSVVSITPGVIIHYTTNGNDPTEADSSLVSGGIVQVTSGVTLKARAFRPDLTPSEVSVATYELVAATPNFNPSAGPITNGTSIVIGSTTSGTTIRYTVDGSDPDLTSPIYSGPVQLNGNTVLKAKAYKPDFDDSAIQSVLFALVDYEDSILMTVAGNGQPGSGNGTGTSAQFSSPEGVCIDGFGNLYVADTGNNQIRKINQAGVVTTFAGTGQPGFLNGAAAGAMFSGPVGVCVDAAGNVYVADTGNSRVRKIDAAGNVSTFAGNGTPGYQDGSPTSAEFLNLCFIESDAQTNLYVGDWGRVRKISANGTVETLAGSGVNNVNDLGASVGLCVDEANTVFAASTYGRIFEITSDGVQSLFAGSSGGAADGPRQTALFLEQSSPARDTSVDHLGNIYVSDYSRVRKISHTGWVSTLGGSVNPGYADGNGRLARFNSCTGLCVDSNGIVYVADTGNHAIRKILPLVVLKSISINANGSISLSWDSVTNRIYSVEFSDDLTHWSTLGSSIIGTGTSLSTTDPITPNHSQRFYRLAVRVN